MAHLSLKTITNFIMGVVLFTTVDRILLKNWSSAPLFKPLNLTQSANIPSSISVFRRQKIRIFCPIVEDTRLKKKCKKPQKRITFVTWRGHRSKYRFQRWRVVFLSTFSDIRNQTSSIFRVARDDAETRTTLWLVSQYGKIFLVSIEEWATGSIWKLQSFILKMIPYVHLTPSLTMPFNFLWNQKCIL